VWRPPEFELTLMNPYCVHKGDHLSAQMRSVFRTFFRISYDVRQFDRLGNAHNPLFDYNWNMVARELHLDWEPDGVVNEV